MQSWSRPFGNLNKLTLASTTLREKKTPTKSIWSIQTKQADFSLCFHLFADMQVNSSRTLRAGCNYSLLRPEIPVLSHCSLLSIIGHLGLPGVRLHSGSIYSTLQNSQTDHIPRPVHTCGLEINPFSEHVLKTREFKTKQEYPLVLRLCFNFGHEKSLTSFFFKKI